MVTAVASSASPNLFSNLGTPDFESVLQSLVRGQGASQTQTASPVSGQPGKTGGGQTILSKATDGVEADGIQTAVNNIQKQSELSQMITVYKQLQNQQQSYLQLAKSVSSAVV